MLKSQLSREHPFPQGPEDHPNKMRLSGFHRPSNKTDIILSWPSDVVTPHVIVFDVVEVNAFHTRFWNSVMASKPRNELGHDSYFVPSLRPPRIQPSGSRILATPLLFIEGNEQTELRKCVCDQPAVGRTRRG
jgi:hypothetical protein